MPPMRTDQPRINIRRAALIFVAGIITASCSEKPAPDREKDASEASRELVRESEVETEELQPGEDKIGEDCVAFVRSAKVVPLGSERRLPGMSCRRDRRVGLPPHENGFGLLLWRYVHRVGDDSRGVQSRCRRSNRWRTDCLDSSGAAKRIFEWAHAIGRTGVSRPHHLQASRRSMAGCRIRSCACRLSPSSPRRVRPIGGRDGMVFSCLSVGARY